MSEDRDHRRRLQSPRFGRRGLLKAGGAAGLAGFIAACSGSSNNGAANSARPPSAPATSGAASSGATAAAVTTPGVRQTAAPTPSQPLKLGGTLRESTLVQAPHFSPFHPGADPSFVNFWRRVYGYYEHLWHYKFLKSPDPKDLLVLELALSVEQPDDSTYIVKLRPSNFHNKPPANGRAISADDEVQTIQYLMKPPASGTSFLQSGKDLKSVEAVDAATVKFTTFGPRAFFYEYTGTREVVPKEMLDEQTLKQTPPVGSGPYQFKNSVQGSSEAMTKYDGFRVKGQPYISDRTLTFLPDPASNEAAFRSGQIDGITFTDIKQRDSVVKDLGNKVNPIDVPSTSGAGMIVNIHRDPWKDPRMREAFYRAMNFDKYNTTVFFGDIIHTWYFSPATSTRFPIGYDAVKQYVGYDPQKAAQLIKAAGWDGSKDLEIMAPAEGDQGIQLCKLIADDLTAVGIKAHVTPVVRNIYLQRGGPKPGDFDIVESVLLDYNYAQTKSGTFWDCSSLEDPEVDAIVDKIYQTIDVTERAKLSNQFEMMLATKYSNFAPLYSGTEHYGYYSYLKGIDQNFHPNVGYQANRWLDK